MLAGPAGVSAGLAQHESIVGSLLINSKGRNGPPNGRGQAAASTIRTAAQEGGRLFDELTRLPECYPTRRER